jgi:hypothetical protein
MPAPPPAWGSAIGGGPRLPAHPQRPAAVLWPYGSKDAAKRAFAERWRGTAPKASHRSAREPFNELGTAKGWMANHTAPCSLRSGDAPVLVLNAGEIAERNVRRKCWLFRMEARHMWKTLPGATFSVGLGLAVATSALAQTNPPGIAPAPSVPPGTTGNPAANQPGIPGAVSPSNPNAASRPQVPNISGSPIVTKPTNRTRCSTGTARGRAGC